MLNYVLEMLVCQVLFLGLYQIFKSEPYFRVNRFYLLLSLIISLVLPLINFTQALPYTFSQTYVHWLQPLQIGGEAVEKSSAIAIENLERSSSFQWNTAQVIYVIGLFLYVLWFIIRNRKVFHYLNLNSFEDYKSKPLVIIPKSHLAFSFWDRIYLGADIPETQRQVILEHEYQHLKQKHSWDVMGVELLQCLLWFNPMIYLYKIQLRQIHEFEADQHVTTLHPKTTYINTLLNQSFGSQNVSFINTFFHKSNLKKRLTMLQHTHSSNLNKLKYLLILPVMVLAVLVSCSQDEIVEPQLTEEEFNDQMMSFMNRLINEDPNVFDVLDDKPNLKEYLKNYDLDIKKNYSKIEIAKIGLLLNMLSISDETKKDNNYYNSILKDINEQKAIKNAHDSFQRRMDSIKLSKKEFQIEKLGGEDASVPYALIDNPPHPDTCNDLSGEALKKCTSAFISKHVNKNFDTGLGKELGLSGRNRVSVQFKIDNNGQVVSVRARGPHPKLEEEAKRVIQSLPQMIPGQVDNENVSVLYGLPINFIIQ